MTKTTTNAGCAGPSAFTLLEVLLVIALIGIVTTALLVGGPRLAGDRPLTAEDVFWRAVGEARHYALLHQTEVRLSYDREARHFTAWTPEGTETFAVPGESDLQLDFLSAQKGGRSIMIGGVVLEAQVIPSITFYDDGTCTPFRVQLRTDQNQPRVIGIDPWTCAALLETEGNR